jgi:hypothetical protein
MAYKWKGTTLSFGTAVTKLTRCQHEESASEIDITSSESARKEFEVAFLEDSVTFTILGSTFAGVVGDIAALTIVWASGGTLSLGNCQIMRRVRGGDTMSAVTTEITLKRTAQ